MNVGCWGHFPTGQWPARAGRFHFEFHEGQSTVVKDDQLHRQVKLPERQQVTHEHRESAVSRQGDDLAIVGKQVVLQSPAAANPTLSATQSENSKAKLGSYDTAVKRAMVVTELTRHHLLDRFIAEHWPHGATPEGQKKLAWLNKIYERYQKSIGIATGETATEDDEPPQGTAFAYEEHLRDYLAQHLELLEKGLKP